MSDKVNDTNRLVDHLFRKEAGRLVVSLTRIFGTVNIQMAEDIVQETLVVALHHWSTGPIPDNPAAWITQVAKRKAINELKRMNRIQGITGDQMAMIENPGLMTPIFLDEEIEDNQLRMIFTCCHPSLPIPSQIALTLKTLCGFGVSEIAKAFLTNKTTINKRLFRAKEKIRNEAIDFNVPQGKELLQRLDSVCLALYLLFNEGYNSSSNNTIISKDLCMEAMRLTKLLVLKFDTTPKLKALLALMCFHVARFDARIDQNGTIIIFEEQNRALWNQELITAGISYLSKAATGSQLSIFHLEAGIAAEHCLSADFQSTNWHSIYEQYQQLYTINQNPLFLLNLAIVESKIKDITYALEELEHLSTNETLKNYPLLHITKGVFYSKIGRKDKAKACFLQGLSATNAKQEIDFINVKLKLCEK